MKWMFLVTADLESRTHARILQVLDNQRIQIHSFVVSADEKWGTVHALVEIEPEKANRVRSLLLKLETVYRIDDFAAFDRECRTVALFEVFCGIATQPSILHTANALGFLVVRTKRCSVVIEVVGSGPEIANCESVLAQLGALKTIAKATFGVVTDEDQRTDAETETGVLPEAPLQSRNCG
jgi:acetolactate synthase small subunit